tara:strand:+ start:248 stop:1549 length:1302 start_codon:yes stop_codon:yes gene_type:complete
MDYSKLVQLGLLQDSDQQNAAQMGLFNMLSQIGAASAPRTSPTPPPMDLSKAMGVYQSSMKNALTQKVLLKQLQDQKKFRTMFDPKPVNEVTAQRMAGNQYRNVLDGPLQEGDYPEDLPERALQTRWDALPGARAQTTMPDALQGLPENFRTLQPFLQRGAQAGMGKDMFKMVGQLIGEEHKYRQPKFHKVLIDGVESYPSTTELNAARARGAVISPINRAANNINLKMPAKVNDTILTQALKRSNTAQDAADTSRSTLVRLSQLSSLLSKAKATGWRTGFGEEVKLQGGKLFQTLGWTSKKTDRALASKEAFIAETTQMILPLVKMLGVNPTDKDLDFVVKGGPEIGKTVEGNQFIIKVLQRAANRSVARANFDMKFMGENADLLQTNPIQYRIKRAKGLDNFVKNHDLWKPITRNQIGISGRSNLPNSLLE